MIRILVVTIIASFFLLSGCSHCENQPPNVQLINNGTGKVDIQIKSSGGSTENINNIYPGNSSEQRSFASGSIEFTISIQGVANPIVYTLEAQNCNDYTVNINSDNTVNSVGTPRNK